jgi:hypothetical protein
MRRAGRDGWTVAARSLAIAVLVPLLVLTTALPATAQQEARGGSAANNFLNPFPENDTWRGLVVGDYLAEGLLNGLLDAMASEPRLQLQRRHRPMQTLTRDSDDDVRAVEDIVSKEKIQIVVLMSGMIDRGGIRLPNGRRLGVGQGDWHAQYASRIDRMVRMLRRKGVAVYWVGLPIMRRSDWSEDIEVINEVIRERAASNGARYIDAFRESADENGQFSDRGPDITGRVVRLRDVEGYDFTAAGYRKLAFFIERQMKRDMNAAREERTIPLAGAEAEQKRINPDAGRPAAGAEPAGKGVRGASASARSAPQGAAGPATELSQQGDLKADNIRVAFKTVGAAGREEQVTVEILRPALSSSVIQLMTRRDRGERPSQIGETLTDTLSNGLLVMRSVTPSRQAGADRAAGRASLTRQPFFIALARGERLPPKPGRADDFRWPREDDIPPPPAAAAAASTPISSPVPLTQPTKGRPKRPPARQ